MHSKNGALAALAGQHYDGELSTDETVLALSTVIVDTMPETLLVIDDLHLASPEAFADVILPLMQFSRGRLRLILAATRSVRAWSARPLAHGYAVGLPPAVLSFRRDEVFELLQHAGAGAGASAGAEADRLWADTQGWPVAVLLALQGGAPSSLDPSAQQEVISQYIETEVLAGLRVELREFVLAATTCELLTGGLAQQLSGRAMRKPSTAGTRRLPATALRFSLAATRLAPGNGTGSPPPGWPRAFRQRPSSMRSTRMTRSSRSSLSKITGCR